MKKLVLSALLTVVSLTIFIIELQIPPLISIPGVKPGLSNTVTLFMLYLGKNWSAADAAMVLVSRILLAALITGQPMTLMFSLSGGVTALISMLFLKNALKKPPPPVLSVLGAVTHNITQICMAALVMNGFSVLFYLPSLIFTGIISGLLTGFAVYYIYKNHPRFINYFNLIK